MRIITGKARGIRLETLEGLETRPTSERSKEAIFSMLQFNIAGSEVLDLFAGSAQMGLEALSRGASSAVMVDQNKDAIRIMEENALKTKLFPQCKIWRSDYMDYIRRNHGEAFDIIFLDPPYAGELLEKSLKYIDEGEILAPDGIIVAESALETELPETFGSLKLEKRYRYGTVAVRIYSYGKEDA